MSELSDASWIAGGSEHPAKVQFMAEHRPARRVVNIILNVHYFWLARPHAGAMISPTTQFNRPFTNTNSVQ